MELSSVGPRVMCGVGSQGGCVVGIDGSKHPLECREHMWELRWARSMRESVGTVTAFVG